MKKYVVLAFSAAAIFALAACGGAAVEAPEAQVPAQEQEQAPAQEQQDPEDTEEQVQQGDALSRADILANMPEFAPSGTLRWGTATTAESTIMTGWGNIVPNAVTRDMIFGNAGVMTANMNGEVFQNPMVTQNIEITDNADGSRTYTITIYPDLRFSDGTYIRALDFAGWAAFISHPYFMDISSAAGWQSVALTRIGYQEFMTGEVDTHSGIRIYSDTQFSVTHSADFLPFIWENESWLLNLYPMAMHVMLPGIDVVDNGYGVTFVGLTPENTAEFINGSNNDGWRFNPSVSAGPYTFVSFDEAATTIVLRANPYFIGTWDGYRPRIEYFIILQRDTPVLVDSLALGEIDIMIGTGGGDVVNPALDLTLSPDFNYTSYVRHGYGLLDFHVDHGPTQFPEVRQAIKWLLDRDEFAFLFTEGHGMVIQGPYSMSQWWYHEALGRGFYDMITHYTYNPERAIEVLEAGGWVLNSQGEPFVLGVDDVRYKDVSHLPQTEDDMLRFGDLMRLEIHWATFTVNRITDITNILLPHEMEAIGMGLVTHIFDNALPHRSRTLDPTPMFHMFNLGLNFVAFSWSPWDTYNPDLMGTGNANFVDNPELFELASRLRFMEIATEAGRDEFVDAWIDLQIFLNEYVLSIPLYADIFYDFYTARLQNWNNNSIWPTAFSVLRAYIVD